MADGTGEKALSAIKRFGAPWRAAFFEHAHSLAEEAQYATVIWIVVAFAAGIGGYFTLSREPPVLVSLIPALTFAVAAWRRPPGVSRLSLALLSAVAAGIAWSSMMAMWRQAPLLERRIGPAAVTGEVISMEERTRGEVRLVIGVRHIEGLAAEETPHKIRLSVRTEIGDVTPGSRVHLRAILWPPKPPSLPGDYDFSRELYFRQIGALGVAISPVMATADGADADADADADAGFRARTERLRLAISARLKAAIPGDAKFIADALVTGFQGAIPAPVVDAMRNAGLAHLLSISGLHMAMVTGIVFFTLRAMLALIEPWALKYPIKKWAAALSIIAAYFYLLISGLQVPAERSFIMAGLVLIAVILDRQAISLRMVALAGLALLALSPVSLVSISFQMSFAAVTALVAFYEYMRQRRRAATERPAPGMAGKLALALAGVVASTLVAEAAIAPAALFYFGNVPLLGVAANAVAIPLTGSLIMPLLILGVVAMPFGLEAWPLALAGKTIQLVIDIAAWISSFDKAVVHVPAMPFAAYLALIAGGVWLVAWRSRIRLLGVAPLLLGVALTVFARPADVFVAGEGNLAAVRLADGSYALTPGRAQKWERDRIAQWSAKETTTWPDHGASSDRWLSCDGLGCVYRPSSGHVVTLPKHTDALADDCRRADVLVADLWLPRACVGLQIKIGRRERRDNGGYALWLEADEVRVETVGDRRNGRPWGGYHLDTKAQSILRRHSHESGNP